MPGAGAGSGPTRFQRRFRRFRRSSEPGKDSGEGLGGFGAEPGQLQQGFRRRFQEALVQSHQVQKGGSGEGSRERLGGFGAEPSSTGFLRRFRRRSGRLWCREVRFNRVPEKVPVKVWEALVQRGQVQQGSGERSGERLGGFGAEPSSTGFLRRFRRRSGRLWCREVRFNRVPEKVPVKVWEALVQRGQVQQGSGERSGERLGGFGAERSGSTGFRRRFRRTSGRLWCREVRFNRVPEKVPVVQRGQVQQGSGEGSGERLGGFGAERSGSTGFRRRFR